MEAKHELKFFVNGKGKVSRKKDASLEFKVKSNLKLSVTRYEGGEEKEAILIAKLSEKKTFEYQCETFGKKLADELHLFKVEQILPNLHYAIYQALAGDFTDPKVGTRPGIALIVDGHLDAGAKNSTPGEVKLSLTADKETKRFKRFVVDKNDKECSGSLYLPKGLPDKIKIKLLLG